jgi:hypothetical protein
LPATVRGVTFTFVAPHTVERELFGPDWLAERHRRAVVGSPLRLGNGVLPRSDH